MADFIYGIGNYLANFFVVIGGNGFYLGDCFGIFYGLGMFFNLSNEEISGFINILFEGNGVGISGYVV